MSEQYVLVPQADIDKVEESRLAMYKNLESVLTGYQLSCLSFDMKGNLWHLTHRRYDKIIIERG